MLLTDLQAFVTRIFTPPRKIQGAELMIIPSLRDIGNSSQSSKVEAQLRECARLLAKHLYVWRKRIPEKSTVKSWNKESLCFQGFDIDSFANFLMEYFTLKPMMNASGCWTNA